MLLYLARHAQTASSAVDSFNGRGELSLTADGRGQARRLGSRLAGVHFAAAYRSPLGRTAETLALIAPRTAAEILPGLSEIDYGRWEGLSPLQARELDPERYDAWVADPLAVAPPDGETAAQVAERALAAVELIRSRHGSSTDPVLAVSHKATLRILGAALTGGPIGKYRIRWAQDECALNLVELRAGRDPFLRLWNDTGHLGADPGLGTRPGKP
jgi:broad specificity phosphatase PhoE